MMARSARPYGPASPVDPAASPPDSPRFPGPSSIERDRSRPAAASAAQACLWILGRRPLRKETKGKRRLVITE
jgi:hypothetical protein